jgi:type II secretory pathway pseudopilin PulG
MNPRRPIPNIAFIPNVDRRASGVGKLTTGHRRPTLDPRRTGCGRSGMTLIELGVVMSIVTVMLALVLGLARHTNEVIKFRRAQAELGEWHETLHAWYLKFGMYPDPYEKSGHMESNLVCLASTDVNSQYIVTLQDGSKVPFCSLSSKPLKPYDPWGAPYFYRSFTNSYELLSCGPNAQHDYTDGQTISHFPAPVTTAADTPNADDVYFEP